MSSITKSRICNILGIPMEGNDETYTRLNFCHDAIAGSVAIVSVNTSDPVTKTSPKRCEELADQAMSRGAKLLIAPFQIKEYPCILVDNVFNAFCKITTDVRNEYNPKTIAITGSIGKTTTTQMVASVLSAKFNTHRNDSSANNARLASYVIQKLNPEHEVYIQETMEGPPYGAAAIISKMVQPQAAIVTVVGTSHMESFGSQERILETCLGIQDGMPKDGLLILNGDDPFQWNAKPERKAVYYAIDNEKADYRAVNIQGQGQYLTFDVLHNGTSTPVTLHCFGKHNVMNAVAAFAAGKWAGMSDAEVVDGISRFKTVGIRQNYVKYGGKHLYLDCYNAAPESMKSAFDALQMIYLPQGGRRVAVLADIKEAGAQEQDFHRLVGELVTNSCIDHLICYGKLSRLIAGVVLLESSIPVFHTESKAELVKYLQQTITNQDVVLFKGSHSMTLEHVVDLTFGTWFHEEYEEYEFRMKYTADQNFRYRVYSDHVAVAEKLSKEQDIVIPEYVAGLPVTSLARSLFYGSAYTRSVVLPNTLVNIRFLAFYKANHIQTIHIPASVRIIEDSAFGSCQKLKSVTIEEGCTHLGFRAFGNCANLKSITIPASVQQIGTEAFINCKRLTIYGVAGSYAEQYAKSVNIPFVSNENNKPKRNLFSKLFR